MGIYNYLKGFLNCIITPLRFLSDYFAYVLKEITTISFVSYLIIEHVCCKKSQTIKSRFDNNRLYNICKNLRLIHILSFLPTFGI